MIDEKKIEEAAVEQLENLGTYGLDEVDLGKEQLVALYREEDVKAMFRAGINWFLENLWHDASEKPKPRTYLLAMYKNNKPCNEAYAPYGIEWLYKEFTEDRWKQFVEGEYITRWLYIEDLMKGGK